jgi:hypothetical protein
MRYLLIFLLFSNSVMAECDWSTIKRVGNEFIYSAECHDKVGKTLIIVDKQTEEINLLRKGIELKDLALQDADRRVILWKDEAYKQYEFVKEVDRKNQWYNAGWFALGMSSILLGAIAIGQVK